MTDTNEIKRSKSGQRRPSLFHAIAQSFLPRLAVKAGLSIVLAEVIILAVIGYYYTQQLSREIDQRAADRVQILGVLIQGSLLKYSAVSDRHIMTDLIGEELLEGMIVAANGNIFHALDKSKIGKNLNIIEDIDPNWFSANQTTPQLIKIDNDIRSHLISITPIFTLGSTQPFLFAYVKVDTAEIQARKSAAKQQFLVGSLISVLLTSLIIFITFNLLILNRIKRAAHFTEKVQQGDLGAKLDDPGSDELGMLESGMNAMVDDLKKRGRQRDDAENNLRIVNETLEQRVKERTEEFSDAVERLKREVASHTQTGKALRRQSSYIRLLQRITVAANESVSTDGALQVCLDTLCTHFHWPIGHVYTISEQDSGLLVSAKIWQFDKPETYIEFKQEAQKTKISLGSGLPGMVLRNGAPIWLEDSLQDDYSLPLKALDQGYSTSFAFPIILGREVVAVFEFFMDGREKPEPDFFEVMRDVGVQLGRIIERKRAEDDLHKAMQAADIANQAKSAFLSDFSHELRTPMNAIIGYGQILTLNEDEPLSEIQSEQMGIMLSASNHLVSLMDQVLDLARIEAGKYPFNIGIIELNDSIVESIALSEPLAKSRHVELIVEKNDVLSTLVMVDPLALKQIILNLLTNAIKYGGAENNVKVTGTRLNNKTVRLSITDQGPGIAEKSLKDIFLPFTRIASSVTTEDGAGVGLSLSKQLACLMNCEIGVDSVIDEGSTFWIDIPCAVEANS